MADYVCLNKPVKIIGCSVNFSVNSDAPKRNYKITVGLMNIKSKSLSTRIFQSVYSELKYHQTSLVAPKYTFVSFYSTFHQN